MKVPVMDHENTGMVKLIASALGVPWECLKEAWVPNKLLLVFTTSAPALDSMKGS